METSETIKVILPAMLKVQTTMESLSKDRENPFASSKYVTLDNILANLKPLLSDNDLILIQNPIAKPGETTTWIGVETKIYHKEGEWFDFGEFLLSFEKGSKMNLAQSAGSLTSYAKRYVLTAIFSIDTNEDTDGVYDKNKSNNAPKQQQNSAPQYQQAPQQAPQQSQQPQYDNYEGKRNFLNDSFNRDFKQHGITADVYGAGMAARIGVSTVFEAELSKMIETSKAWAKELNRPQQNNTQQQAVPWGQ